MAEPTIISVESSESETSLTQAQQLGQLMELSRQTAENQLAMSQRLDTMAQMQEAQGRQIEELWSRNSQTAERVEEVRTQAVVAAAVVAEAVAEAESEEAQEAETIEVTPEPEPKDDPTPEPEPKTAPPWIVRKFLGE